MKKVNRYQVRYFPKTDGIAYSKTTRRLREYRRAVKLKNYLKRKGFDSFLVKFEIPE